ncbi:MAG TPA: AAA family ATPase [Bacteroidetes bacterium]|nr:AAA family ATPase [Bacteroidota bacterium]
MCKKWLFVPVTDEVFFTLLLFGIFYDLNGYAPGIEANRFLHLKDKRFFWKKKDKQGKVVNLRKPCCKSKNKMKRILKGNSDFGYIISNKGYFVDKTMFVKEFFDSGDSVVVLPRPRRFGKTLNLSMVEHFFDIRKKESTTFFSGYKISGEKGFCEIHQNKYPVINITLKGVGGENWEECFLYLTNAVTELYRHHDYLLDSDKLKNYDKQFVEKIILKKAGQIDYELSLKNLSIYMAKHFGKETIILIDEYDAPIIEGYQENYYKRVINFMQGFLGAAFKGNHALHKGLITGILRVAKESLFSKFNNPGIYTIVDPYFSDKFGFTEQETKKALEYFGLQGDFEKVKHWYDGYKFGNTDNIYNPWSIINYMDRHVQGFKPYWVNTGSDPLIKKRILEPGIDNTYDELQKLISGETLTKTLDENFVFSDLEGKKRLLWTLLTFSGYLTQIEKIDYETYKLKIPNFEINTIFKNIVFDWLEDEHKVPKELLVATTEHLVNNRIPQFEKGFKKIIGDTFSYFDERGMAENVYQAYFLGMLAIVGDDYAIRSNRESGDGRYDILLIPHNKSKYGLVIEVKRVDKRGEKEKEASYNKRVNAALKKALEQIERNKYYKELISHKIKKIIKLPVVFAGKEAHVLPLPEKKRTYSSPQLF